MKRIITNMVLKHIMDTEGCTQDEAQEILDDVMNEVNIAIAEGDYDLAEDIWTGDLGMDLDYMLEMLI